MGMFARGSDGWTEEEKYGIISLYKVEEVN